MGGIRFMLQASRIKCKFLQPQIRDINKVIAYRGKILKDIMII